jgi:DNA-binding response OmpR family regulator
MTAWPTYTSDMHTVLIISKDTEMISIWKTLFQQKNCYVFNETTPHAALQSAKLTSPSLIILDLDLPRSTRLELCQQLRTTTSGTLLLLAPSNDSRHRFEYTGAGVNEHIVTPISPMALFVKSMAWLVWQEHTVSFA